jgi:NTE family protein
MKKISLVLGGGGVRGYAHIGVIKRLQEKKIIPNEIIGTSFGALVGVCLASGKNYEEIKHIFLPKNTLKFIDPAEKFKMGFIKGEKLVQYILDSINCEKFSDLKIKFIVNAIDINTGKEKVFSKGNLFDALSASIAVPGVISPKKIGEKFYIDGGMYSPIALNLVSENIDEIIAIDVTDVIVKINEQSDKIIVVQQMLNLSQKREMNLLMKDINKKIILLCPLKKSYHLFDFRKKSREEIIKMGYSEAKMKIK